MPSLFSRAIRIKYSDWLKIRSGHGILIYSAGHGLTAARSKAVLLLRFFFVCASVVSNMAFVLSVFVPILSFFWFLGQAVFHYCGISSVSSLFLKDV